LTNLAYDVYKGLENVKGVDLTFNNNIQEVMDDDQPSKFPELINQNFNDEEVLKSNNFTKQLK
jgi:hypothetical protein